MNKQISFEEYRGIDLALFAVILVVFEAIMTLAAVRWFPEQPYSLSITAVITAIVMMRWGGYSLIHALLGGAVFCFASGAASGGMTGEALSVFATYMLGNLFAMLALPLLVKVGKEKTRQNVLASLAFGLGIILLMQGGRAVMSLLFGGTLREAIGFFTTDVISDLFTLIVIWIVRRLDGVFEDQKIYLLRQQRERENERAEAGQGEGGAE